MRSSRRCSGVVAALQIADGPGRHWRRIRASRQCSVRGMVSVKAGIGAVEARAVVGEHVVAAAHRAQARFPAPRRRCIRSLRPGAARAARRRRLRRVTSSTLPLASVITQWRPSRRAGTLPRLRMWMVYANTKRPSSGADCSSRKRVATSMSMACRWCSSCRQCSPSVAVERSAAGRLARRMKPATSTCSARASGRRPAASIVVGVGTRRSARCAGSCGAGRRRRARRARKRSRSCDADLAARQRHQAHHRGIDLRRRPERARRHVEQRRRRGSSACSITLRRP